MKDSELRAIALQRFYAERRRNSKIWNESDVPDGVNPIDFFDVCGQLAQHGLIDWEPIRDMFTVKSGQGKITASGVDVVEGNSKPSIAITFDQRGTVNINGSNNIVGDNNLLRLEKVNSEISQSNFSEGEKAEAKSLWQKVCDNKLLNTVVGSIFGAVTKHALETTTQTK
jgi:hypothetical protein